MEESEKIFVSIIMPVKNVEKYINQCIESIINQTYTQFELIILDDSEDNTTKIISCYTDKRIKHILCGGNISQKLNYGIQIAKHEYICRMDGDDYCDLNRLKRQIEFLKKHSNEIDIVGCNMIYIDKNKSELLKKRFPENHEEIVYLMPIFTSLPHPTLLTYKNIILSIGGYNEDYSGAEDLDLFLRLINKGYKFYNLQEYLYYNTIRNEIYQTFHPYNKLSYSIGYNYLEKTKNTNTNYIAQIALLEYYKGDIRKSRQYFVKSLLDSKISFFRFLRYFIISLLGGRILNYLRNRQIAKNISFFFTRTFGHDYRFVKPNKHIKLFNQ